MGMWRNCKKCGVGIYLLQEIDSTWTAYVDDDGTARHVCQECTEIEFNDFRLGSIFEIGSCSRRIAYKALGAAGDFDFNFKAWEAFYVGRAGESYIKDILHKKGYRIVSKQKDVSFFGFFGRIDGLILINNRLNLLECKTIPDPVKFKAFIEGSLEHDHPRYYSQVQAYLASTRVENCFLIVLGDDAWYEVNIPKNHAVIDVLRRKADRLKETIRKAELPEGDPYDRPVLECDYCPYKSPCKGME